MATTNPHSTERAEGHLVDLRRLARRPRGRSGDRLRGQAALQSSDGGEEGTARIGCHRSAVWRVAVRHDGKIELANQKERP